MEDIEQGIISTIESARMDRGISVAELARQHHYPATKQEAYSVNAAWGSSEPFLVLSTNVSPISSPVLPLTEAFPPLRVLHG